MQSQGFASFSCPTQDQFRAEVAWPGDWPEAQAGEAPPEAPGDGEEAHEDEEMADLLGREWSYMTGRSPYSCFLSYFFYHFDVMF